MRILVGILVGSALLGQDKPVPAPAAAPAAASPLPSSENWFTGTFDLGERWRSSVGGSLSTYRSVVDLGSGPKLLGADFTILGLKRHYFDRIRVRTHRSVVTLG